MGEGLSIKHQYIMADEENTEVEAEETEEEETEEETEE